MDGKIYHIMSLIPQNGAKYVATNLGYFAKKRKKDSKILLIDLDFDNSTLAYFYTKDYTYSIDNLMPVKNDIKKATIYNNVIKTNLGFDILKGTSIKSSDYISSDLVAIILNLVKKMYDYIFVVTQSNLKNPSTVITLLNTNEVILVLRNNYSNLIKSTKFIQEIKPFIEGKSALNIVINYKDYNNEVNISEVIKSTEEININCLGVLDYDIKSVDNLNLKKRGYFKRKSINDRVFKHICKEIL